MQLLLRRGGGGGNRRDNNPGEGDAVSRSGGDSRRRRESLNGDLYAMRSAGATTHCAEGIALYVREDVILRRVGRHKFQDFGAFRVLPTPTTRMTRREYRISGRDYRIQRPPGGPM